MEVVVAFEKGRMRGGDHRLEEGGWTERAGETLVAGPRVRDEGDDEAKMPGEGERFQVEEEEDDREDLPYVRSWAEA